MTSSVSALAAPLVVVLGASGGLGASTWSAALARRLSLHLGSCVLVDGDVRGGGLDMTCGTEHVPGLRWPDLARLRGTTSCERLLAALPSGEVPVLSAGGDGRAVPDSAVIDVVGSLLGKVAVVVDARAGSTVASALTARAAVVHVVAGVRARQLADAEAVLGWFESPDGDVAPDLGLVTRGERTLGPEVADAVEQWGVPHLAHVRDDGRVRRDGERGEWPGLRGSLRDAADVVALDLVERLGREAA